MKNNVIIGAGVTGLTLAERLAAKDENVLIIEKRSTIGGNCYDYFDEDNNYIQLYGPHIFHTDDEEVWNYVNKFSEFNNYIHKVYCHVDGKLINIPFNLNSLYKAFDNLKADKLKEILINEIGINNKVPILKLLNHKNDFIKELAKFIYEKIFLYYTMKQWGKKPEEIDQSVTDRVPVFVSMDDRYFKCRWQGIPKNGFTKMFEKMIDRPNIKIILSTDYKDIIKNLKYDKIYYTGPLDYFFDYEYGKIKYRRIWLDFEKLNTNSYQENSVINYPNDFKFTRITEYNKFLFINNKTTVISREYSSWDKGFEAYPVQDEENKEIVSKYLNKAKNYDNLVLIGRLAECKYYDIDQAIKRALEEVI
ncbi:MAG: UDP-galactopyranose mutase [Candidatus Goldbacteria bacterium]|nr:UDP-galactopyranose mutase [Candidatus Goldiibacteriota bacterium]